MKKKNSFEKMQIIRYMGNKRSILNHVVKEIKKIHQPSKYFCDLMGGTNAVGYAIKTLKEYNTKVISNDSEIYSFVIAKTLIQNNKIKSIPTKLVEKELLKNFEKNLNSIDQKWSPQYISKNQYRTIKNNKHKFKNKGSTYCLFSFYYANVFFSQKQCKEIDSLRYAIDQVKDRNKKYFYLTALLFAVSYGSTSFGHFAQPRRISKDVKYIRQKSILNLFFEKIKEMEIEFNEHNNFCFNQKIDSLIKNRHFKKLSNCIGTFYLDPPYSEANYSRFYHLLETLIKYDYPKNEFKGLYRDKRFISSFTHKSKVKESFQKIIKYCYENKSNLIISYSNTGLLSKKEIKDLCRTYYPPKHVKSAKDIHHLHSTQGNRKKNGVKEILIICKY